MAGDVCETLTLGYLAARQDDSDRFRLWEMAGTSHADVYTFVVGRIDSGTVAIEELAQAWRPSNEVVGSVIEHPVNAGPQRYVLAAAMRRNEVGRAQLTLQRRDGSTFDAACSVSPIASASGRTPYFVGVVHDLTNDLRPREEKASSEYQWRHDLSVLSAAARVFTDRCVAGIEADEERCKALIEGSLAMCTSLAPKIGYDKAAAVAKEAYKSGKTVRQVATEQQVLSSGELGATLDPWSMTEPG